MAGETLRDVVARLNASVTAVAALGAALDARVGQRPLDPNLRPHIDGVLDALGIRDEVENAGVEELRPLLGEIRTFDLTGAKLFSARAAHQAGWTHLEGDLLEAAGDVTAGLPRRLRTAIAPKLDGLEARLSSAGAAFLDIGVGVGVLAIEMARLWPELTVVGIDTWAPALTMARDRVRAADLEHRIVLREQAGEAIEDVEAFDLAWIPSVFVPERVLPKVMARVHVALRPGGWLLLPMMRAAGEPLQAAITRLRVAHFGGSLLTTERAGALLAEQGFVNVHPLPAPADSNAAMMVAQRPVTSDRG